MKETTRLMLLIMLIIAGSCGSKHKENLAEVTDEDGLITAEFYQIKDSIIRYTHIREISGRGTLMVHEGILGEPGKHFEIFEERREDLVVRISELVVNLKKEQYNLYPPEEYSQMIIQIDSSQWGDLEDLDKFILVEDLINSTLMATGNGRITGSDINANVSFFATVYHSKTATQSILKALKAQGFDFQMVVAIEQGSDIKVIWPKNFQGEFSLI